MKFRSWHSCWISRYWCCELLPCYFFCWCSCNRFLF